MKFRVFGLFAVLLLVSACNLSRVPASGDSISVPTFESVSVTEIPPVKTCYGWRIHLVSVTRTDVGEGWLSLTGNVVWENVNASPSAFGPFRGDILAVWESTQVTTNEGYSYPLESEAWTEWEDWIGKYYVPAGFMYRLSTNYESQDDRWSVKVSSATTGWKADTPCGLLDFENPEPGLLFPSWEGLPTIGSSIEIEKMSLTIDEYGACGPSLCGQLTFTNHDLGADQKVPFRYFFLDSQGYTSTLKEGLGTAGPGQSISIEAGPIDSRHVNRGVLLIVQQYSYNQGYIGGPAWAVVLRMPS